MKHIVYTKPTPVFNTGRYNALHKEIRESKTKEDKLKFLSLMSKEFPDEFSEEIAYLRDTAKYSPMSKDLLSEICNWDICNEYLALQIACTLFNLCAYEVCYICFKVTYAKAKTLNIKLDCLYYLCYSEDTENKSFVQEMICSILKYSISSEEKYKLIQSFSSDSVKPFTHSKKISVEYDPYFVFNIHLFFFKDKSNDLMYRLLSAALLLQIEFENITDEIKQSREGIISELKSQAKDTTLPEYIRAEIIDIIKRLTNEKEWSNKLLEEISYEKGNVLSEAKSIYANKHNVHEFEQWCNTCIIDLMKTTEARYTLDDIRKSIDDCLSKTDHEKIYKCNKSINRISCDMTTYSPLKITLLQILERIYYKIISKTNSGNLVNRLIDELTDMSGKCGTGHLIRLFNILEEYSFKISFEEQLKNNIIGRINAKIKSESAEKKDALFLGMAEDSSAKQKTVYQNYILDIKSDLGNELYKEFVNEGYMTADKFYGEFERVISTISKINK